jgi:hypothetical protein
MSYPHAPPIFEQLSVDDRRRDTQLQWLCNAGRTNIECRLLDQSRRMTCLTPTEAMSEPQTFRAAG